MPEAIYDLVYFLWFLLARPLVIALVGLFLAYDRSGMSVGLLIVLAPHAWGLLVATWKSR